MQDRFTKPTYEDIKALPEHLTGELLNGELFAHARPGGPHIRAASRLGAFLLNRFDVGITGPDGWHILDEPEVHLKNHILVPDIAGWQRKRLPKVPKNTFFDVAPDWVCEVLSPSTARTDWSVKLPLYAKLMDGFAWYLDPLSKVLHVLRVQNGKHTSLDIFIGDIKIKAPPFDSYELDLTQLWPEEDEEKPTTPTEPATT